MREVVALQNKMCRMNSIDMHTSHHHIIIIYLASVSSTILSAKTKILGNEDIFEEDLRKLTNDIVRNHFNHYRCITYVTSDLERPWPLNSDIPIYQIDLTDDFSQDLIIDLSYFEGCGGYVVRSRPEKKEEIMLALISSFTNTTNFRYNRQRYIYLPYDEKDKELNVLNHEKMFFTPNLIMATVEDSRKYYNFSLWSHNWFHGHKYDVMGVKYEILEYWTAQRGFEGLIKNIYYDRTENLYGKQVMMALIQYPIYTIIVKEGNKTIYDGMETRLAVTWVDKANGTWDAIDHPVHFWGDVHEDGHADGILGSVMYHRADMGYAAVYQWHCDAVACSYTYVYPGITCMVPRPKRGPGYLTVLLSFTPKTWIALASTYVISSLVVFIISTIRETQLTDEIKPLISGELLFTAFFNTFRLQVEQIPKVAHKKNSLGLYVKFLNVYYFFVANCWIGGIAALLTMPRFEPPINTVNDLIVRYPKLEWGANAVAWIEAIRQSEEPDIKFIVEKYVILDDKALHERTKTGDFAFFIERLPKGHFGINDYIDMESLKYLKIMEDNIYYANPVIVYPRGSPYQEPVDKMIFKLFDMGVIQKIEVQTALDRIDNRFQNLIRTSTDPPTEEQTSLQVRHIEGPLFIYIGGISLASSVFLLELIYFRIKKTLSKTDKTQFR